MLTMAATRCLTLFALATPASARLLSAALNLRGGQVQAALFDFDGTLAQSEDTHRRTFSELLGFELTPDYWNAKCVGNSPRSILEKHIAPERLEAGETVDGLLQRRCLRKLPNPPAPPGTSAPSRRSFRQMSTQHTTPCHGPSHIRPRTALFEAYIAAGKLEETRGALRIVSELRQRGVPCAVVSSGERSYIIKALEALGMLDMFQVAICIYSSIGSISGIK